MPVLVWSLLIGLVAGSRTMMAPVAISWAVALGRLHPHGTALAFLGSWITVAIFSALATGELVGDALPITPSRKVPLQFGARLASGALTGAAIGLSAEAGAAGLAAGLIGAAIGTLAGAALRARTARAIGRDLPAALLEDAIALGGAALIVAKLT